VSFAAAFKQPLFYFALAGAITFVVDAWLRRDADVIRITDGVRREVASEFSGAHLRAPTNEELEQGVQAWTETELLFREADRLGLAENDATVRNHLARKLSQVVGQRTINEAPTDSELFEELRIHRDRYVKADTFTVTHVFVSRASTPETYEARVTEALNRLNAGAESHTVGDHFPRGPVFERLPQQQLEALLGVKLEAALQPEQQGRWQALTGTRGTHLLRLDEMVSGEPTLENSRDSLVGSVQARKSEAAVRAFVSELRTKFTIVDESKH
jgi:hypothetical protein